MHEHSQHHDLNIEGPSDRNFGLVFSALFLLVALQPVLYGHGIRIWSAAASFVFALSAIFIPSSLASLNRLWGKFGLFLHGIVNLFILAILFYFIITPIGLIMRLMGKDPLCLGFDHQQPSYWTQRIPSGPDAESFKNQF